MKIQVYVGENVENLKFSCGGGVVGFDRGKVIYSTDSTHRSLPESSLHPRRYQAKLKREIEHCLFIGVNLIFNTHSRDTFRILSELILNNKISHEQIEIFVLNEDNTNIDKIIRFTKEGFLDENWPYGFFAIEWNF